MYEQCYIRAISVLYLCFICALSVLYPYWDYGASVTSVRTGTKIKAAVNFEL